MTFEEEVEFMEKEHEAVHHTEIVDRCAECYKEVTGHDLPLGGLSQETQDKLESLERYNLLRDNPSE